MAQRTLNDRDEVTNRNGSRLTGWEPNANPEYGFSLSDTTSPGIPNYLAAPTLAIGFGTTGTAIIERTIEHVLAESGSLRTSIGYLGIDADARSPSLDSDHFVSIGVDGAGTNPHKGRELLECHRDKVTDALMSQVDRLFRPDSLFGTEKSARQAVTVDLVAGSGGTSGGCLAPMLDLIHEVGRRRHIQDLRVHVHLIGPEISIGDIHRNVAPDQAKRIYATFAENLQMIYGRMAADFAPIDQFNSPTDTTPYVFSLSIIDQSNGQSEFATIEPFIDMAGRALFLERFSYAGQHFQARACDHRGLGGHAGTAH